MKTGDLVVIDHHNAGRKTFAAVVSNPPGTTGRLDRTHVRVLTSKRSTFEHTADITPTGWYFAEIGRNSKDDPPFVHSKAIPSTVHQGGILRHAGQNITVRFQSPEHGTSSVFRGEEDPVRFPTPVAALRYVGLEATLLWP